MQLIAFLPEHLMALKLQAAQSSAQSLMTAEHGAEIVGAGGRAWTAVVDGKPIACAGMIEFWKGRAYAWAYLSEDFKAHAKSVHRATLELLSGAPWRRVEMTVDVHHGAAKRWAAHLGFEREGVCRAWTPDGRDVELWARVN